MIGERRSTPERRQTFGQFQNAERARLIARNAELVALLKSAHEAMEEEVNNQDGRDVFGLACGNCEAGVPMPHSLGCRIVSAIRAGEQK